MRTTFELSPTELRGCLPARRQGPLRPAESPCICPYRPPFDWQTIIRFLKSRATPGTEIVEERCYRRTIEIDGEAGEIEVRPVPDEAQLRARVALEL